MSMLKIIHTLEELDTEAGAFVEGLAPRASGATLVTLSGELGAGKTALVRAVAKALGVEEAVTSPTFVLEKIYKLGHPMSKFGWLVHIDAYRLGGGAELASLGFDELMNESGNLILLEWPERVAEVLPEAFAALTLVARADGAHTIAYD